SERSRPQYARRRPRTHEVMSAWQPGRRPGTRVPTVAAGLAEADMASVDEDAEVDDVLEIESASRTLKSPSAAAHSDGMLAASANLYPGRRVRIPLRFEFVR